MAPSNGQLPAAALAPIAQGHLEIHAAAGWNMMNVEARKRGLELVPTGSMSSYRTLDQQKILYARYLKGGNLAAKPGTSNHGWGLAVDVATPAMRSMIDTIGAMYGWSKQWSDAPTEWWHIKYEVGHYSGPDPGPYGQPALIPTPPEGTVALAVATMSDGRFEVFVETSSGEVFHAWHVGERRWLGRVKTGSERDLVFAWKTGCQVSEYCQEDVFGRRLQPSRSRGLCQAHYARWWKRGGNPAITMARGRRALPIPPIHQVFNPEAGTPRYQHLHKWMKRMFLRAGRCEWCGNTKKRTVYANARSDGYTYNRADWLELCDRCHVHFDMSVSPEWVGDHGPSSPRPMFVRSGSCVRRGRAGSRVSASSSVSRTS